MDRYDDPDRIYRYKYASENHSLVDRLYKYWWAIAFKAVPARISANLLSMLGNLGSWLALGLAIAFGADQGPTKPWIFVVCGLAVFFYHTVDCLDGMQARRIGASGPLGEFVDHWFDAMNVFFFPLTIIAAFPVVPTWMAVLLIYISNVSDWVVLKEVVNKGRLYFGPVSSEEGITIHMLFLLSVPLLGYGFWAEPGALFGVPPVLLVLGFVILGHAVSIAITLRALRLDGWKELCVQSASTLPLLAWTIAGQALGMPRWTVILGLLAIGFIGTRHVGDLLRVRLVGLRYPAYYPDLLVGSAASLLAVLALALRPGLSPALYAAPVIAVMAMTAVALTRQFYRTAARVRECLGHGVFYVPPENNPDNGR